MPGFFFIARFIQLAAIFGLSLIPIFAYSRPYSNIELTSSNSKGLAFRATIPDPGDYLAFAEVDSAFCPTQTILIGVPIESEPFIISSRGNMASGLTPAMKDRFRCDRTGLAEIIFTRVIRGKKIAAVGIYPYRDGIFYRQVEVSIGFIGAGGSADTEMAREHNIIFDPIFKASILNYEQFSRWPKESRSRGTKKVNANPFKASAIWYKISTLQQGLIKISGQNLAAAGASLSALASDSIHLFYGGGEPLQVLNDRPRPTMKEVSLMVFDGGDGEFDPTDYIVFYAEGADRLRFPADSEGVFLENPYTDTNCYWLTVSGDFGDKGKRAEIVSGVPHILPDTAINAGRFYAKTGQNLILMRDNEGAIEDYYQWYWTDENDFTFYIDLPTAMASESATVKIRAATPDMDLYINDYPIALSYKRDREFLFSAGNILKRGNNKFAVSMRDNYDSPPHFDYCLVSYKGELVPSANELDAEIKSRAGAANIAISDQFNAEPYILDVTDVYSPRIIEGSVARDDSIIFGYNYDSDSKRRFYICSSSKLYPAAKIEKVNAPDLMDETAQIDLIIIAPDQFLPYLQSYGAYREAQSDINIRLVSLDDVFNQFSFGQYDPTAIRDYLKYAYENYPEPAPSAVLLVGDGSYDFENNLNTATRNFVPPFVHAFDSTSSDDNYVFFGQYGILDGDTSYSEDRGYDMMIARWPARNASQLSAVIDKIQSYEASTNFAPWRATVTVVADDEYGAYDGETFHTKRTEELQLYHLPAAFKRNKIYSWDYPFASGGLKPEVNDAITRSFNEGALLINYAGHGNPDTWAHERIFNRNSDLPRLRNADRLPLVFTASCSIGFFDDPTREGMAEDLLRLANGGAIAVIAATRLVYAGENADFNNLFYDFLFGGDSLSICQAMFAAKLFRQYAYSAPRPIRNDRTYAFFGDPFLKLGIPHYEAQFTEYPDTLKALALHSVRGRIIDPISGEKQPFEGTLDIFAYDSEAEKTYKVYYESGQVFDSVVYSLGGAAIFRGATPVQDGEFSFSFIAPLDISYGGRSAKISGYAYSSVSDALGTADSIPVSLEIASSSDADGPEIKYAFSDRKNFESGDKITPEDNLVLLIADSSGVNLTGGLGHEIALTIDGEAEKAVNLTDLFEYEPGSHTSGRIEYDLAALEAGRHEFKVKAWDNANNSSIVTFAAEVIEGGQLMISDLLNYPNPMKDETTISFSLTAAAKAVNLEIFTLSGKRIFRYEKMSVPPDFYQFYTWNGLDSDGDKVAVGVYIYKVTAVAESSGQTAESFGKLVVVN
jgi:hypothetical protein